MVLDPLDYLVEEVGVAGSDVYEVVGFALPDGDRHDSPPGPFLPDTDVLYPVQVAVLESGWEPVLEGSRLLVDLEEESLDPRKVLRGRIAPGQGRQLEHLTVGSIFFA